MGETTDAFMEFLRMAETVRTIVGMEIHVQLATKSKLFCCCALDFGAEPNSRVCPVCSGMPGTLPVLNKHALELSIRMGLALNCRIASFSKWDRKSYYYPDLPKNYQISQFDLPVAEGGIFETGINGDTKKVRIRRAHLEEDAGKNIHDTPGCTLVDLNRTGTPLLEIVTEPDIESADHAWEFATELQQLAITLGISEASMQKGHMRFEPNVNLSITKDGVEYRTPIAEVKNLNSFRAVREAIEYESKRQLQAWKADNDYVFGKASNENRGWNDSKKVTEFQRGKEAAHDYRYFPDPDLVPVTIEESVLDEIRAELPELPRARRIRFMNDYDLSSKDAATLVADKATADLFESAIGTGAPASMVGRQMVNVWSKIANDREITIAALGISADAIGGLATLVEDGTISATAANKIAPELLESDASPAELAEKMGLVQVQDLGQMEAWVDEAIAANEKAFTDAVGSPKKAQKAAGFLRGQVMRISGGKADPKLVGEIIERKIAEAGE